MTGQVEWRHCALRTRGRSQQRTGGTSRQRGSRDLVTWHHSVIGNGMTWWGELGIMRLGEESCDAVRSHVMLWGVTWCCEESRDVVRSHVAKIQRGHAGMFTKLTQRSFSCRGWVCLHIHMVSQHNAIQV